MHPGHRVLLRVGLASCVGCSVAMPHQSVRTMLQRRQRFCSHRTTQRSQILQPSQGGMARSTSLLQLVQRSQQHTAPTLCPTAQVLCSARGPTTMQQQARCAPAVCMAMQHKAMAAAVSPAVSQVSAGFPGWGCCAVHPLSQLRHHPGVHIHPLLCQKPTQESRAISRTLPSCALGAMCGARSCVHGVLQDYGHCVIWPGGSDVARDQPAQFMLDDRVAS